MNRPRTDVDSIVYKLNDVMAVYGKSVSERGAHVWIDALDGYQTDEILQAFDDHVKGESTGRSENESKYAPKPIHIVSLIKAKRAYHKGYEKRPEHEPMADPLIGKAWVICMKRFYDFEVTDANPDVDLTFEQALEIVNREAAKYRRPDAIPNEYKLTEYWGG